MKTLYYNATVYSYGEFFEAFIVEDDTFVSVGKTQDLLNGDYDEKVDLEGAFVCPGFNDSHMHLTNYGYYLNLVNFNNHTDSLKELLRYLKEFVDNNPDREWIRGRGWNQDYFTDVKRMPNRYDLDKISKDKPIYISRTCGHCCVVNTKALELANINNDTPSPIGGLIEKDENGPTGVLYDNAMSLVSSLIPSPDKKEIKDIIIAAAKSLNSYGITSVQSDDYCTFKDVEFEVINDAYKELSEAGLLTLRVYEQCKLNDIHILKDFINKGNRTGMGDKMFKLGPLKIVADGSLGSRTAYMSKPYNDDPDNCGLPLYTDEELKEMTICADSNGMQIATHAIGDACLDQILNAYKEVIHDENRLRHGIVHCQIMRKDQLKQMCDMNLLAYIQSVFLDYDNHIVYARAGKELAESSYNWKTLLNGKCNVSNGSDAPVEIPDVLKGIQCAVTRTSLDGTGPYLIDQAFDIKEAIDSFTVSGAYASFEEDYKGQIKKGYLADFVVLADNPFKVDKTQIAKIKVLNTYMNGKCVYSNS